MDLVIVISYETAAGKRLWTVNSLLVHHPPLFCACRPFLQRKKEYHGALYDYVCVHVLAVLLFQTMGDAKRIKRIEHDDYVTLFQSVLS